MTTLRQAWLLPFDKSMVGRSDAHSAKFSSVPARPPQNLKQKDAIILTKSRRDVTLSSRQRHRQENRTTDGAVYLSTACSPRLPLAKCRSRGETRCTTRTRRTRKPLLAHPCHRHSYSRCHSLEDSHHLPHHYHHGHRHRGVLLGLWYESQDPR